MPADPTCPDEIQTLRVRAAVDALAPRGVTGEVLWAAPDPTADDQAVILNTPFWGYGLNFGDVVRLGPEDHVGVREILEVVVASGHRRLMVITGPHAVAGLNERLRRTFGEDALRIEGGGEDLLTVSVPPSIDPRNVFDEMHVWLHERGACGRDDVALFPVIETRLGPLAGPAE